MILELSGNRVSDDVLHQVNDFLVRNKNGDPILGTSKKRLQSPSSHAGPQNFEAPSTMHTGGLAGAPQIPLHYEDSDDFHNERHQIEERRLDLARELEEESVRRRQAEEALERVREEFLKRELEESRVKSEMAARIEQLESEKQSL